jgi:hypothetical protein
VLYAKSPGGVEATAARVARWRPLIEKSAEKYDVDPDTLEAIVFLESAGRPEVEAGGNPDSAVGLAQILPETGAGLLAMNVDIERSRRIASRLARLGRIAARAKKKRTRDRAAREARELLALRPRVDQRYDPAASLDGAARYIVFARKELGREDLAAASYHMGVGNLQDVIAEYVRPRPLTGSTPRTVEKYDITWSKLYFDSTPLRNPKTFRKLYSLGDDSRHYVFKLEAARQIMGWWHDDEVDTIRSIASLQTSKASAEDLLRPQSEYPPYKNARDLRRAYRDGELIALPDEPRRLGFRIDRGMGSLAKRIKERKALFIGLRPEALATLVYLTKEVRAIAGSSSLRVTSTVRDLKYQDALIGVNVQATRKFSLHTTGFAFDILRNFRTRAQERATIATLERLRALNVIDFVYEPAALHVTVGPRAEELLPVLDKLIERP